MSISFIRTVFLLGAISFLSPSASQACSIPSNDVLDELRDDPEIHPFTKGNDAGATARAVVSAHFDRFFQSATSFERFPSMGMASVKQMLNKEGPVDRTQGGTTNIFWSHQVYDYVVGSMDFSDFITIDSNSGMNGNLKWGKIHFYLTPDNVAQKFTDLVQNTDLETMDGAVEICEMPGNEVFVTYTLKANLKDGFLNNVLEVGMGYLLKQSLGRMLEAITEDATK